MGDNKQKGSRHDYCNNQHQHRFGQHEHRRNGRRGGDEEREAVPGDLIYLPTRLPHMVRALEPSVMMLTMVTAARAHDAIDV